MKLFTRSIPVTIIILLLSSFLEAQEAGERNISVTYSCYLTGFPGNGKELSVWIPVPVSNDRQRVEITSADLTLGKITREEKYGNKMYYRRVDISSWPQKDTLHISLAYNVKLNEKKVQEASQLSPIPKTVPQNMQVYLAGNRLIPLEGPVANLTKQLDLPSQPILAARQVYDYLINAMVYNYKAPGAGRGDVIWACTNKTGDCSDYNSIFIGICRSSGIPADHTFGLPLKPGKNEVKDWHCWASFWVKGPGWITIDASEASKHPELRDYNFGTLSNTYLTLTHGRDIVLEPAQKGEALNIFADPYAEIDGKIFEGVKWVVHYQELN
ncbi:MAG: transglutaminase-like domain-containing protein [Bacteroidota bacterium]